MFARFLMLVCTVASLAVLTSAGAGAEGLPLGFSVRVVLDGPGKGSVHAVSTSFSHTYMSPSCSSAAGAGACIVTQYNGLPIVFQATAAPGSVFSGWLGTDCNGPQAICTAFGNGQMWARFELESPPPLGPLRHQLAVDTAGTGSGTVAGSALPSGPPISCPSACVRTYTPGTLVALQATPAAQSVFAGWSGSCSGTSTTCMVTMDRAREATAAFNGSLTGLVQTLSVSLAGTGQGTVDGQGITCAPDCTGSYAMGKPVTLTAHPATGSTFTGWNGACSGSGATCTVVMVSNRSVGATFALASSPAPGSGSGGSSGSGSSGGGAPAAQPAPSGQPAPDGGSSGDAGSSAPTSGGSGSSKPAPSPKACTIVGTAGNDVLVGTSHRDVICGRGGNDTLIGKGGADLLRGGLGRDSLRGGLGTDRLEGGAGTDVFYAHDGLRDSLAGGAGKDRAQVDRKKDVLGGIETVS